MTSHFAKIDGAPAYRQVRDAVEREILAGRLKPGDPLPTETVLAKDFGVNRSTLREGVRLLEQDGLVERRGARRLFVALPHYRDLATRASRALVLHRITFRELWEASMALELATMGYAAKRITPALIAALDANIAEAALAAKAGDVEAFLRLDVAFHELLAGATGNRVLVLAREPVSLLFFPAGRAVLPKLRTYKRVVDAHRQIVDALSADDGPRAVDWMRRHMADFKRAFEAAGLALDRPVDLAAGTGGVS
ncbi:MAG: FadR family transcriptional regulator [Alphaproteobacteria bacterium]|nr:FadR family transcriptional regulator [Alphaproteobacteria bacterium]